jgi:hypothetical protein
MRLRQWLVVILGPSAVVAISFLPILVTDAPGTSRELGGYGSSKSQGGDVYVRPHVRQDGTYVQPHMRTAPNTSPLDNYSSKGNVNPYTGKEGTVDPYRFTPYQSR